MRFLLDTQIALWAIQRSPKLGDKAAGTILRPENQLFVSAVSLWEIAIKHQLPARRDPVPISARRAQSLFEQAGYGILPVTASHATVVDDLPPHHGDPFDRLIVAQAFTEPMRLLTRDARLKEYGELVTLA